ncbi:hypothetical protein MUA04_23935 [Enterobacteriaceae bacterium H11S18]|uniref:hypothetical protein n=1 Tax=Dryocola clanedunensis TaxID=2925396 RepID=UPI0022F0D37A|nr:hypothetical protein [Dryocola clanedunensis]MCT4713225.1 hypothetical protein [Dryocola clanedunensis]
MTDIYHHISQPCLRESSTETLKEMSRDCDAAVSGLLAGMRAMGSMAFWACDSENYSPSLAAEDLRDLGESLMYLPRIVQALSENANNADFELRQREAKVRK